MKARERRRVVRVDEVASSAVAVAHQRLERQMRGASPIAKHQPAMASTITATGAMRARASDGRSSRRRHGGALRRHGRAVTGA